MSKDRSYWKENINLIVKCLFIWFLSSYVFSIILVDQLNEIRLGGYKKDEKVSDVFAASDYIKVIYSSEGQKKITLGLESFIDIALLDSKKTKAVKLTSEDLDFQLDKYLRAEINQKNHTVVQPAVGFNRIRI